MCAPHAQRSAPEARHGWGVRRRASLPNRVPENPTEERAGKDDMGVELVIRLVALLLAALATGGLMVNWIGLARAMARVSSPSAYTEFHQATNLTFDPYMPIVVFGALCGGIALAVVSSGVGSASGRLAISGAACYAVVIVISLSTNVRTNKLIAGWSIQSPPDNWKAIRAGWIRWHLLRTLVSVPGLVCYILSGLLSAQ
jgi:Domain of unknown function (DUF1772)